MSGSIKRGDRAVGRIDFAEADWQRNEFGVDMLTLSADPLTGAITLALRTPSGLAYPEREHFYTCDEDLYQFAGEFHHDEELPFFEGDYVYRPPGTVYGHSQGSSGGLIIAALNNRPVRRHFDDHPPWEGEYLVDREWNTREVQPFVVRPTELPWNSTGLSGGVEIKPLRGAPGERSRLFGARPHSPWGADSVFLMALPAGYSGPAPGWRDASLEVLVTSGQASLGGFDWFRGCYSFGGFVGHCDVTERLEVYVRLFLPPDAQPSL